jgi:hypothetical protein
LYAVVPCRKKKSEALLAGPHHVNHATAVWRAALLPEAAANIQARLAVPPFENWLRRHLSANTPYDQMVRDLLTASLGNGANPLVRSTTPDLQTNRKGYIAADPEALRTSKRGVFAAGDIVTGGATVILAMAAGRKAARSIDEYLRG